MPRVTIDGAPYEVLPGATILEQIRSCGRDVPTLCDDERLAPFGGCRLCLVEVDGRSRPVTACDTPIAHGMSIRTSTDAVEAQRAALLRLLARDYPRDAVERQPEKPFHRLLRAYGLEGIASGDSDPALLDTTHPYIQVDMSRCIDCYRCVRICEEVQGQFVWAAWNRGDRTRIAPRTAATLRDSACVSCGACVDTCPSGALEDVSVLERGEADALDEDDLPVLRRRLRDARRERATSGSVSVRPALDAPVNQGHLCVKGRYAFDFAHAADRVTRPMIRRDGVWREVSWEEAIAFVAAELRRIVERSWRAQRRHPRLGARHQRGQLPGPEVRARRARHQQRRLLRARLPRADRGGDEDDARHRRGDQLVRRHRAGAHDPRLRRESDREPPDRRRAHQAGRAARRAPHRDRSAPHRARASTRTCTSSSGPAPTSRCSTRSPA